MFQVTSDTLLPNPALQFHGFPLLCVRIEAHTKVEAWVTAGPGSHRDLLHSVAADPLQRQFQQEAPHRSGSFHAQGVTPGTIESMRFPGGAQDWPLDSDHSCLLTLLTLIKHIYDDW